MALHAPNPERSVLSDGRLIKKVLRKRSCLTCGTACHADSVSAEDARALYVHGYELAKAAPGSDAVRALAYANWLTDKFSPPRAVLEVGCGSGTLLRELSRRWPDASCIGIDPALPEETYADAGLRLRRGGIEDMPAETDGFDLIIAINVIEHMPDPAAFLAALQARLAASGQIAFVCPVAEPPNVELLFYDHFYSFTSHALAAIISSASLRLRKIAPAPPAIGDFQLIITEASQPVSSFMPAERSFADLGAERQSYLETWRELDAALLARLDDRKRLVAFGGGQAAALLRAYAPRLWDRLEAIILDAPEEVWNLGKPVESYRDVVHSLGDADILIATAPRAQKMLAQRLQDDGLRPILYDDLVAQ
jgi:SAM-dependent methyltransferase